MFCGQFACEDDLPVCRDCIRKMSRLLAEKCFTCGKYAFDCQCRDAGLVYFLFFYGNRFSKRIIRRVKEDADKSTVEFLCRMLLSLTGIGIRKFDCVTYVPRSLRSKRRTGYDQSQLLAESVSKYTGIPLVHSLVRVGGEEQKLLGASDRRKNMLKRYRVNDKLVSEGKGLGNVLLVDDVCTTGATLYACATLLRRAGADTVTPLALAKTNFKK